MAATTLGQSAVGASLLAKNVNDNAAKLDLSGALKILASKLGPTKTINAINAQHRTRAVRPTLPLNNPPAS